jgi:gluconate 5-dehydrogenase
MTNLFSLKNKVVLITGGYGYLGKSITEGLAEYGAEVVVLARNEDKFKGAFESSDLKNIYFQDFDIASTESIKTGFQAIFERFGQIDVLINNAFYVRSNTPETLSDEDWNYSIDGSLNSVYRCIREVLPYMKQSESGRIINMASMYGMVAPDFTVYKEFPNFLNRNANNWTGNPNEPPSNDGARHARSRAQFHCTTRRYPSNVDEIHRWTKYGKPVWQRDYEQRSNKKKQSDM